MKPEEFEAFARGMVPPGAFQPAAHYDPDGDCIEVFFTDEPFVGERLDQWVTVYRQRGSREIAGSLIKGVRKLLARYPGFNIDVYDQKVRLSHVLRAPAWSEGDPVKQRTYKILIEKAEESDINTEVGAAR